MPVDDFELFIGGRFDRRKSSSVLQVHTRQKYRRIRRSGLPLTGTGGIMVSDTEI
jgi:hypothetical protein